MRRKYEDTQLARKIQIYIWFASEYLSISVSAVNN